MLKSLIVNVFKLISGIFNGFPQAEAIPVRVNRSNGRHLLVLGVILVPSLLAAQVPQGIYPNTVDANGKKQGAWKKLDEKGTVIYVGQFKDDKPYGLFTYFDTDGKKMTEMNFSKDGVVAYAKMYYVDGKLQAEGKYINQKKDSVWNFYNVDGLFLSTENWVNGKKDGKSVVYHPGTKQPASITIFKNGLEEGEYVEYYLDGQIKMKATYVTGNLEGTATWYFADGRINILGAYQHAVKHGKWTYYNADGTVKGTETWTFGKLTSQETLIKPDDLYKTIENPQDPNHDANPGGGGGN
jgi:antitoxin component YwqK of YwqJK toxin-antitoxin module